MMTPERTTTAVRRREQNESIEHIVRVLAVGKSSVSRAREVQRCALGKGASRYPASPTFGGGIRERGG